MLARSGSRGRGQKFGYLIGHCKHLDSGVKSLSFEQKSIQCDILFGHYGWYVENKRGTSMEFEYVQQSMCEVLMALVMMVHGSIP